MSPEDVIDENFFCRGIRTPSGVRFQCHDIRGTMAMLAKMSPFFINLREHLFIETELGYAVVDSVYEDGIHLLYFTGRGAGKSEWVRVATMMGDIGRSKRTFIEQ